MLGLAEQNQSGNMNDKFTYDIAFSFAGEDREYVGTVADSLKANGIKVFYDEHEKTELWGKDLYEHLDVVYREKARYCIIFISKHYANKLWTNHERKSAQERAFRENREYILPARFDDTEVPGIRSTVGYINLRDYTPEEFSELVIKKIGNQGSVDLEMRSNPDTIVYEFTLKPKPTANFTYQELLTACKKKFVEVQEKK